MSDPSSSGKRPRIELAGQMAGEYQLGRKLGEGSFGAVYAAEHPVLKRRAAVKVLHQNAGEDSDAVLRFVSEAQVVNQIRSRHIVDVFSFGQLPDGRHFYVMDLLEGEPLDVRLRREKFLAVPIAIQILRPIAEALDAAHLAGVVHRDLKPQNLFLTWTPDGETVPKLLDFGMAKLFGDSVVNTLSGTPVGTPLYMSPEQSRGETVDGRADVYALGVVCHELLTGELPISGSSTLAVLMGQIMGDPTRASDARPELSPELDGPILHMLQKSPGARPPTASAAIADLVLAAEKAGHVIPPGMPHLERPPVSPDRDSAGGGSLGVAQTDWASARQARTSQRQRATRVRWGGSFALLVAAAGVAVYLITARMNAAPSPRRAGGDPASATTLAAASVAAPAAVAPASVPALPVHSPRSVDLTLRGAPRGARVLLDDQPLGEAPGPIAVPFGESRLQLTVTAPGHEPTTVSLVPDRAATLTVKLKRRGGGSGAPRNPAIPNDLENPF